MSFAFAAGRTERALTLGEGVSNFHPECELCKDGRIQAVSCAGYLFLYGTGSRIKHLLVLQVLQFTAGILAYFVKGQLFSTDKLFNLKHRQTGLKCQIRMSQTLGENMLAVTQIYLSPSFPVSPYPCGLFVVMIMLEKL